MPESLRGRPLGPEWRVATHTSEELVLEQHGGPGLQRVGGALVVVVGTLALAGALALATPDDARLIGWPVAALLLVVSALGLTAAVRNLQRARLGVRLRVTAGEVEGWPVAFAWRPRRVPTADVAQVSVKVYAHPPLKLAMLEVILKDGTLLSGPEVAVQTGDAHPLDAVAAAASALIGAHSARS